MENRYLLQPSTQHPHHWVFTDTQYGIVITFREHQFNATQHVTILDDHPDMTANDVARLLTRMGDYLHDNHYDIIF